jgi:hypothetical protein
MSSGYSGAHRPLLAAMLPAGNEAADEGDADDADNPPSPDAADASASAAADAGTSNAANVNALVDAEDQPIPSPRPNTPDEGPAISAGVDTQPSLSPINDTEETLIEPSVDPKEPHIDSMFTSEFETQSELLTFQRQETPSPIREYFV